MSFHPVFVPAQGEYVATSISLPDEGARGLAVLLQGSLATRSHRNRLWTKISMELADRGIASVRLDYPGMGESTGNHLSSMNRPPVDAVAAATRVGLDAAGVNSYSVVGNCLGARTAILLAETIPGCRGVGLILTAGLKGIGRRKATHRGASVFKLIVRAAPSLRHIGRHSGQRPREGTMRLAPEVETLLQSTPMLFLFIGAEQTWLRLNAGLSGPIDRGGPEVSERVERVFVRASGSRGLLPLAGQEAVLRVVPDWVDRITSAYSSRESEKV